MIHFIINLALFQATWLTCVLSAAAGYDGVLAPFAVLLALGTHLALSPDRGRQVRIMLAALLLGLTGEATLSYSQTIWYFGIGFGHAPPLWIGCLWLAFGTTLDVTFRPLQTRLRVAALLGGAFGPLAYAAAERLDALWIREPLIGAYAHIALLWAVLLPVLLVVARRMPGGGTRRVEDAS